MSYFRTNIFIFTLTSGRLGHWVSLQSLAKCFQVREGCGLKWRNPSLHLKRCFVSCDLLYINRVAFGLCEMYFCELEWVISLNRFIGYMCCGVEVTCSKINLGKK